VLEKPTDPDLGYSRVHLCSALGGKEGQGPKGRKGKDRSNQANGEEAETLNNMSYMSYISANNNSISIYDWLLDSGTTSHICPICNAFINYYPMLSLPSGSLCIFVKLTLDGLFSYHKSATVVEECESGMNYLSV